MQQQTRDTQVCAVTHSQTRKLGGSQVLPEVEGKQELSPPGCFTPQATSSPKPPRVETQDMSYVCPADLAGKCVSAPMSGDVQLDDAGYATVPPCDLSQKAETDDSPISPPLKISVK